MTTVTRAQMRQILLSAAADLEAERAAQAAEEAAEDLNFPAIVWWVLVAIASIGSFLAGLILGGVPMVGQ
jgi:hypothetical protein